MFIQFTFNLGPAVQMHNFVYLNVLLFVARILLCYVEVSVFLWLFWFQVFLHQERASADRRAVDAQTSVTLENTQHARVFSSIRPGKQIKALLLPGVQCKQTLRSFPPVFLLLGWNAGALQFERARGRCPDFSCALSRCNIPGTAVTCSSLTTRPPCLVSMIKLSFVYHFYFQGICSVEALFSWVSWAYVTNVWGEISLHVQIIPGRFYLYLFVI